jgi:enterochelin esterase family protein
VAVNQDVPARVYLPPCYAAEGDIDYPTAYFLHGKPYTETQWTDLGLPGLVAEAADAGTFPPMILVLARQPEPLFSGSDGGPGSYETEFLDGLMAAVDANFATMEGPQGRAVIGLSRGGVWALEIALRHPEAIRYVVALSPALAVNLARPAYDPFALAAEGDARATRFLLAAGEEDWARAKTELFATTVAPRAAAAEVVLVPGSHTDSTWQALLPTVLAFLAQAFGAAALDGG